MLTKRYPFPEWKELEEEYKKKSDDDFLIPDILSFVVVRETCEPHERFKIENKNTELTTHLPSPTHFPGNAY
jgi:hypothetical protein